MKLEKLVALLILTTPLLSFADEESQLKRACVGQILGPVQTAHQMKTGPLKKVIFSEKIDSQFVALFAELQRLTLKVKDKSKPDPEISKQVRSLFDQAGALTEKSAPRELGLCLDWMKSLVAETKKVCPNFEQDSKVEEKKKKCLETAGASPSVKAKNDAWMGALKKLVIADPAKKSTP